MPLLESVLSNLKLSQPFRNFLSNFLILLLIIPGRATFRNLSRYSADVEKTFSRWFRRKVDWASLNMAAILFSTDVNLNPATLYRYDNSFLLTMDPVDTDYFKFSLGLVAHFNRGPSALVQYQTLPGYEDLASHAIMAQLRWEF